MVKTPKLYFFDTGLACSLLKINSTAELNNSHFQGALFESWIITDLYKQFCNRGLPPSLYFWRDKGGSHEIDCILDLAGKQYPIEITAGNTIASDAFTGINYWNKIAAANPQAAYLV